LCVYIWLVRLIFLSGFATYMEGLGNPQCLPSIRNQRLQNTRDNEHLVECHQECMISYFTPCMQITWCIMFLCNQSDNNMSGLQGYWCIFHVMYHTSLIFILIVYVLCWISLLIGHIDSSSLRPKVTSKSMKQSLVVWHTWLYSRQWNMEAAPNKKKCHIETVLIGFFLQKNCYNLALWTPH